MKTMRETGLVLLGALLTLGLTLGATTTVAQTIRHRGPSYHIDHHDHVIRDSHGHVIGKYHHDVVHQDSSFIVPHTSGHHHGTYYVRNGLSYYNPQTSSARLSVVRPQTVQFGGFAHVDDLATRLETMSNEFCLDLHYNYSHNPSFHETYGEAYQVLQAAQFIHEAEHRHDRSAIRRKLGGLDRLVHHLQDDVRGWSRHQHRQVGHLGILSKLDLIESTLHHLMNDVGVQATPIAGAEQAPPPGRLPEQAPPPANRTVPFSSSPPLPVP